MSRYVKIEIPLFTMLFAVSMISSAVMLYTLSLFIYTPILANAFSMQYASIYTFLIFFGFLFRSFEEIVNIGSTYMYRKQEFEADAFAIETTHLNDSFIASLKKLSVDNLSNVTPHPLKVFLEYSHPPVLQRIEEIKRL